MKNLKTLIWGFVVMVSFFFANCTKLDEHNDVSTNENLFTKKSEIGTRISNIVTPKNDPTQDINCIDFIYPVTIQIYDSNRNVIGIRTFTSDSQFSNFLGTISDTQEISISYPIRTMYTDGTTFTINSNSELKIAIDNCSQDEIISYCDGLFSPSAKKSYWKIEYNTIGDNRYLSGYFEPKPDHTIEFHYGNAVINGTWNFSILNDKLHININLAQISQIATDLNIDSEVQIINDLMIVKNSKDLFLREYVEKSTVFPIGATGDAGGVVVYDKSFYSDGWRYIEVNTHEFTNLQWGCINSNIIECQNVQVGSGFYNSGKILNAHDNLLNYYQNPSVCSTTNDGSVSSKTAVASNLNAKKGWFLPSIDELNLVYTNLKATQIVNFTNSVFWSATQNNTSTVKCVDFTNGQTLLKTKNLSNKFITIRYF